MDEYHGVGPARLDYRVDPVGRLPPEYIDRVLAGYARSLRYVEWGARRRDADWGGGGRREPGSGDLASWYVTDLYHAGQLFAFRARVFVSRGDWAGAEQSLRTGLSAARHLGHEPLLNHCAVQAGMAADLMENGVAHWVTRPGSPNLYWTLTELPRPFVDLWPVRQWEQEALRDQMPNLAAALFGEVSAERWPQVLWEVARTVVRDRSRGRPGRPYEPSPAGPEVDAEAGRLVEVGLSRARRSLVDSGVPAETVDRMTPAQVVGTYLVSDYRAAEDELWQAWALPYRVAEGQMLRADQARGAARRAAAAAGEPPLPSFDRVRVMPWGGGDLPSVLDVRYRVARADRWIGLLRTVEALRDYAARHDGRLPERLEQVTDLPVPVDEVTGEPFRYRLDGRIATIDLPGSRYAGGAGGGQRVELTVEP